MEEHNGPGGLDDCYVLVVNKLKAAKSEIDNFTLNRLLVLDQHDNTKQSASDMYQKMGFYNFSMYF